MPRYQEPTPDEYVRIADKVRSGEYFREAKSMTNTLLHDTMAERYFYLLITLVAMICFFCALYAMQSLYPLSRTVPFIYVLNDATEDLPRIEALRTAPEQSVDEAVLLFMARNYVTHYESYDISALERNFSAVQHYSAPEVFANYQLLLQTNNPDSPVVLYQRHSTRKIDVMSLTQPSNNTLEIFYEASVISADHVAKTKHKAILNYEYSKVEFDAENDKVKDVNFKVTNYKSFMVQ